MSQKDEQEHRYDLESYEKQQTRVRLASSLIATTVSETIRSQLYEDALVDDPNKAFEFLKSQYNVSDHRAR